LYKIAFTGGGTAGHIIPNIALMDSLDNKQYSFIYVGQSDSMEEQIIKQKGVTFYPISAGKLRRYFSWKNVSDVFRVIKGFFQAKKILREQSPDLLFSKGGFVCVPVVYAAHFLHIPIIIHESDLTLGLANRLSAPIADFICYTFEQTGSRIGRKNIRHTGIPIRKELLSGERDKGLKLCGFDGNLPVVLVLGGSLGSQSINVALNSQLEALTEIFQVCHICGKNNRSIHSIPNRYQSFEYVNEDLAHLYAMADLIVARAGATTVYEILKLRKPGLLVPLPLNASRGDQIENCKILSKAELANVLYEENLTPENLVQKIIETYNNKSIYINNIANYDIKDGNEELINAIQELLKRQQS